MAGTRLKVAGTGLEVAGTLRSGRYMTRSAGTRLAVAVTKLGVEGPKLVLGFGPNSNAPPCSYLNYYILMIN